jgi:uncharacterized cupredoxin-like copper-binding protein
MDALVRTRKAKRWTVGVVLAAAAALVLGACGGDNAKSSSQTKSKSTPSSSSATKVTVEESEFTLKLSTTTFHPGKYTFEAKNVGKAPHAIEIEGPGLSEAKSATITGGGTTSITVTLQKGKYELYCPVGHHKDKGMKTDIIVV